MRLLLIVPLACIGLAACANDHTAPPPPPATSAPEPAPKPAVVEPVNISQNEAQQRCQLQAVKHDNVRLTDVKVTSTKTVDAGYLTKLKIGTVTRTCIVTPNGDIRSYQ